MTKIATEIVEVPSICRHNEKLSVRFGEIVDASADEDCRCSICCGLELVIAISSTG